MMTKTVDVFQSQASLNELLSLVRKGIEIIFTEGNLPLARLEPIGTTSSQRFAGLHEGAIWTSEDFDEPLPEKFWAGGA